MKIERFEPKLDWRYGTVSRVNDTLYLAGIVAEGPGDITQQTREVLTTIKDLLEKYGSDMDHIVSCHIFLKNMEEDFQAFNKVWSTFFKDDTLPVRATLEVKGFVRPHVLVEIMPIAVVK